jgi:class 3 adenylate cyclase
MNIISWNALFLFFKAKTYPLLIGFYWIIIHEGICQDQKVADSLKTIYHEDKLRGTDKLELLRNLSFNEINDTELSLKYAEELIVLSKLENNNLYLYRGYHRKGSNHIRAGDLDLALNAFFKSIDVAAEVKYIEGEASAYISVGDVYSIMGNSDNAQKYYNKSIQILRNTSDSITLASALLNAGDDFFNSGKYEKALIYFEESGRIFKEKKYVIGTAYNLGNSGMVYAIQGKDSIAEQKINEAISILEELEDYYPIAVYLTYMSNIYLKKNDFDNALSYANRSLELSAKVGLKEQISDAYLQLSKLYELSGDPDPALKYYKNHISYKDSVQNIEAVQKLANIRTDFEVSQIQMEVDLLNQQKRNQLITIIASIIVLLLILIISIGLYKRYIFIKKTKSIIEAEKNKSDELLLNILPLEIADELKNTGKSAARNFDNVSVLFTDFKEFTKIAETLNANELVEEIDTCFKEFDQIITNHDIEKIKTIGDAYMATGGLNTPSKIAVKNVIQAGLEMLSFMKSRKTDLQKKSKPYFEMRVGIHTGPVVAGIVGVKKFQYDIWGDTVNIANRMERSGEIGRLNISETTYNLIKDDPEFGFEYRGKVLAKNKGELDMYFVDVVSHLKIQN